MRIHFIAIGGSAMHNLAIALKQNGHIVSGSDDEIFEPSRSRLTNHGLLPSKVGWQPEIINDSLDVIILGMHARPDNPELLRAQQLKLKVYSYPEYLYEQCRNKKRVVIGGSHGKTTVTAMIMHALQYNKVDFDYMVGAQLDGFDTMVRLSSEAPLAIFEGDEYLSSPIDLRPKFLWYKPHLALITGVAWDHINVFPTIDAYNLQFKLFVESVQPGGYITWFGEDEVLGSIMENASNVKSESYFSVKNKLENGRSVVLFNNQAYSVPVFGSHNFQNMAGAMNICRELGVSADDFLSSMATFKGASRRLQILAEKPGGTVFYDFAHAPSKVKATVKAVKERFPERKLKAILELHTFSSLNAAFLPQYLDSMACADEAYVFFNPEVLAHKRLPAITSRQVAVAFNIPECNVVTTTEAVAGLIRATSLEKSNLLVMTSGNFGGLKLQKLVDEL
ncbi:UDP-N-acetylmuramate--L-alanine ligase [Geofilum sp. OHC36d9]|uniref:UDP-N-acetylmuramate--L-alanine ligase n=1 Tax=Geofilum sp. OHC36d9 TaxID=3458413 RepID=UPI00403423E1